MEQKQKHQCACGGNCACNSKKSKITKDMTIAEVVNQKPEAAELLYEIGLGCAGCVLSGVETLEQGCKGHGGMSDQEVDEVVQMLNA